MVLYVVTVAVWLAAVCVAVLTKFSIPVFPFRRERQGQTLQSGMGDRIVPIPLVRPRSSVHEK